jgi:tetratricopeptide (TPR) repeat protein
LFESVSDFLRSAADETAVVLIFDDLHAADRPSLLLLDFLGRGLGDTRLLIVGTYRESDARVAPGLAEPLSKMAREGDHLPLRGLSETEVRDLIEERSGRSPTDALVSAIHRSTEGNPFFVDEVVRLLAAEGRLEKGVPDDKLPLPEGVRGLIAKRLEPLPDPARSLLAIASVVGRDFRVSTLERVSEAGRAQLMDLLDVAAAHGIVTEVPDALGHYSFGHALIRETLYDHLSRGRRIELHRRIGEVLEATYASDPEPHLAELAHHFYEAARGGDVGKAVEYARRAGDRALRLLAHEEAARQYELALQALESAEQLDTAHQFRLLSGLGEAWMRSGERERGRQVFLRVADLARERDRPEELARAALGYGAGLSWYTFVHASDERLVSLLEEALEALAEGDSVLRVSLLARLAVERFYGNRTEESARLASEAVAVADRLGSPEARLLALYSRQWSFVHPQDLADLLRTSDEVVRLSVELGDTEMEFRGRNFRLRTLLQLGDIKAVDAEIRALTRLAEELHQAVYEWQITGLRAMRALPGGDRAAGSGGVCGRAAWRRRGGAQLLRRTAVPTPVVPGPARRAGGTNQGGGRASPRATRRSARLLHAAAQRAGQRCRGHGRARSDGRRRVRGNPP